MADEDLQMPDEALVDELEATFGRELMEKLDTALATVNAGGREQTREAAFAELRSLHLVYIKDWVVNSMAIAYLNPKEKPHV